MNPRFAYSESSDASIYIQHRDTETQRKKLCISVPLKRNNEKIDDMIVLLLGDKFKQSFSEEELKANYGYPKETDDELAEWDCDNM